QGWGRDELVHARSLPGVERAEAARAPALADQAALELAARRLGHAARADQRNRRRLDPMIGDQGGPDGLRDPGQRLWLQPGSPPASLLHQISPIRPGASRTPDAASTMATSPSRDQRPLVASVRTVSASASASLGVAGIASPCSRADRSKARASI